MDEIVEFHLSLNSMPAKSSDKLCSQKESSCWTQRHMPTICNMYNAHFTWNAFENNIPDADIHPILAHLCNLNFCKLFSIWHSVWSGWMGIPSFFAFNILAFNFHIQHSTSYSCLCILQLVCFHCSVKFKFLFYWP